MYTRTRDYLGGLLSLPSDRLALQELPSPWVSWRSGLPSTEIGDWPGPGEQLEMLREMLRALRSLLPL